MSFWTAIVVIVAITMVASVIMKRYEALGRGESGRSRDQDADKLAHQREADRRELEELRERVKVLERIATDANASHALESRRVADEIEALRDR